MSSTRMIVWSAVMLWVSLAAGRAEANHDRLFQPGPPDNHGHVSHWSWRPSGSPPDNMSLIEVKFFIHSHTGVAQEEMTAGMVDAIREAAETWSMDNTLALVNLVEVDDAGDADIHVHLGNLDGTVGGILGQVFHSFLGHESVDYDDGHNWHRILSATLVMDSNELWFGGADFAQVILHEFGHALGVGHADPVTEPDSVMIQDIGQQGSVLTAEDLEALRHLYGVAVLLGDANNDLQVTGADLIAVQQNFGNVGPPDDGTLPGDANDDGQVTGADLIAVQQNFGNVLAPAGVPVPEPGTALVWIALGCLAACRRGTRPSGPRQMDTSTSTRPIHAQLLYGRTS